MERTEQKSPVHCVWEMGMHQSKTVLGQVRRVNGWVRPALEQCTQFLFKKGEFELFETPKLAGEMRIPPPERAGSAGQSQQQKSMQEIILLII